MQHLGSCDLTPICRNRWLWQGAFRTSEVPGSVSWKHGSSCSLLSQLSELGQNISFCRLSYTGNHPSPEREKVNFFDQFACFFKSGFLRPCEAEVGVEDATVWVLWCVDYVRFHLAGNFTPRSLWKVLQIELPFSYSGNPFHLWEVNRSDNFIFREKMTKLFLV